MSSRNNPVEVSNTVVNGVRSLLNKRNSKSWTGTMTALDGVLSTILGKRAEVLPGSPSALRVSLNRNINRLRARGIRVRFGRETNHNRTRYVEFVAR